MCFCVLRGLQKLFWQWQDAGRTQLPKLARRLAGCVHSPNHTHGPCVTRDMAVHREATKDISHVHSPVQMCVGPRHIPCKYSCSRCVQGFVPRTSRTLHLMGKRCMVVFHVGSILVVLDVNGCSFVTLIRLQLTKDIHPPLLQQHDNMHTLVV